MLNENIIAPDFEALDQDGEIQSLSRYRGSWVLLYFYPRDNTPGCTKEACVMRDEMTNFDDLEAVVLGVSTDSVESHAKFAEKFKLPFTLISDKDKKIVKLYEANGLVKRISYLIDPEGKIAKAYPKVKPAEHALQVLKDLKELKSA